MLHGLGAFPVTALSVRSKKSFSATVVTYDLWCDLKVCRRELCRRFSKCWRVGSERTPLHVHPRGDVIKCCTSWWVLGAAVCWAASLLAAWGFHPGSRALANRRKHCAGTKAQRGRINLTCFLSTNTISSLLTGSVLCFDGLSLP